MKNIYFIIASVAALIYVVVEVRKNHFSVKESFWWVIAALGMIFLSIFPYTFDYIAKFLSISYGPSLLFVICIIFLLFINFRSSKKISDMQMKITDLAEHIAILEQKLKSKPKK